jgi:hypothetical protein
LPLHWSSKGSAETKDYEIDWTPQLSVGDTIASSVWSQPPSSTLVLSSSAVDATATKAIVNIGGGLPNTTYTITNTITTAVVRDVFVRSVEIWVQA